MLVTLVFVFTYKEVYSLIPCPKQSLRNKRPFSMLICAHSHCILTTARKSQHLFSHQDPMLTPFPPFLFNMPSVLLWPRCLHYGLSCDPSRRSHAICRVSLPCLQTPGINLLTLVSSFLQQVELSAVLQSGHAQTQMEGTKEQAPENRSSQINFQMGLHCYVGNSARDQSQKELRRRTLTESR